MKCPKCGFQPKLGRPRKIEREDVLTLRKKGYSLRAIAKLIGVSVSTVCVALRRK